jgi:hypothetical protein
MTKEEKLITADRLIEEGYNELYPDTVHPITVAEQEYYEKISNTFARISDDNQVMHSFASKADW